ncbi:MAG: mandelate racemase/muconate lactonizing enzyme family protein [Caldilineaceae bacterium]|nr:mandelate racemase/muconate lactonizing enzyme family protein [Caldilineaceae bacterium]
MKITSIETFQLRCPLGEPFGWSQGWIDHRTTGIVKITTDAGIVGWGEGCTGPAAAVIAEIFAPFLLGADPRNRNTLWQQMFAALYNANQAVGFGGSAISAIDMALWDIAGKVAEQPISALLGGCIRDKVAVYATGLYYTKDEFPTKLLAEAKGYVDAGYKGMKTKVGGLAVAEDVRRVTALRRAIGDDIQLMVDANEGYNAATAIRIGHQLADLNLLWFEEPVNAQDLAGYGQIKAALPMALAGGEALRTRYEFAPFLTGHVFDIAQPDVVNVGGISELRNVAMTANTLGIQVNPHVWGSPIMIAATLHVAATLPPCPPARNPQPFAQEPVMEFDRTPSAIRETLCRVPFNQVDGFVAVPQGPGLGIEIDEQALAMLTTQHDRYTVDSRTVEQ